MPETLEKLTEWGEFRLGVATGAIMVPVAHRQASKERVARQEYERDRESELDARLMTKKRRIDELHSINDQLRKENRALREQRGENS